MGNSRRGKHELGALRELLVEILAREWAVRTAAVAFVGSLGERSSALEIHLHDAPDLVEAACLDLRIEDRTHPGHHLLDGLTAHELVGELVNAGLAPQRDAREHERGTELGFELALCD